MYNKEYYIQLIFLILISITLGILIGGLINSDEEVEQVHTKAPVKVVPPTKILIDLNQDDEAEWYTLIPEE